MVRLKRFGADRIILTAILAGVMIAGVGIFRSQPEKTGIGEDDFWRMKASWYHCADMVISGDSRVYHAISPREMNTATKEIPCDKLRIRNFGFSGGGFDRNFLDATQDVLDPAGLRVIVLGITPHSLTLKSVEDNGFMDFQKKIHSRKNIPPPPLGQAGWQGFFSRMTIKKLWRTVRLKKPKKYYLNHYFSDGWVAGTRIPQLPQKALKPFEEVFKKYKVDSDLENEIFDATARWSKKGIIVAAFRVPTSKAMIELENRISGFDEIEFIEKFTAAGGVWIDLDQGGYRSYDGSHIHSNIPYDNNFPGSESFFNSAEKLSRDLAKKLVEKGVLPKAK